MKQIPLHRTDLTVSQLALGTADFGTKYDQAAAFAQLDRFFEAGGTLIDTARVYGTWVPGAGNASERVIGEWLRTRGCRSRVVLSTKGCHPSVESMGAPRVRPDELRRDLDGSLAALGTDRVELYFLHRDDPSVPVDELLGCLEEQVRAGKIRYYGCSNWTLGRIEGAQAAAKRHAFTGFVCDQALFSLAVIDREKIWDPTLIELTPEAAAHHLRENWNVMAYMAAGRGVLTKLLRGGEMPAHLAPAYDNPVNRRLAVALAQLEREEGIPSDQAALAYLMQQPLRTIPTVSFSRIEQLESALQSCARRLPDEAMARLGALRAGAAPDEGAQDA